MKILKIFISFSLLILRPSWALPSKGLYKCINGNNDSICEQNFQIRIQNNQATLIAIEYVGYCGSQGPYRYACENNVCSDGHIRVTLREHNYLWENLDHQFYCEFKKL
jgi:hypothetical protein